MYRTILVCTDGSARSGRAVKAAVRISRDMGSRLVALNVQPAYEALLLYPDFVATAYPESDFRRDSQRRSQRVLDRVVRAAKAAGVPCTPVAARGEPAEAIVKTARTRRCDLIVMASHGRGAVASALLGSTTSKVLARCRVPVLVHR